jgi:hypothetical protein
MANCESAIRDYLKKIEPTLTQNDGAQRSHNYLREILCTGQFTSRIKTSYLSGSYERDTAIAPLDDVDIIFVIYPKAWQTGLLSLYPTPRTVLESFARAVRYRYNDSSVRMQRRSICLQLYHLDIDLVPAIEADAAGQMILVPDAETGNWIKSSPRTHSYIATSINQNRKGNFKPLVKLLKRWNSNLPSTANFKSFAIETMAARLFQTTDIPNLQDGLLRFFDFVAHLDGKAQAYTWSDQCSISLNRWSTEVPDLAETGSNLVAKVDGERRKKFLEYAVRSRDRMIDALTAVSVDTACKRVSEALRL